MNMLLRITSNKVSFTDIIKVVLGKWWSSWMIHLRIAPVDVFFTFSDRYS